MFLHLSISHSVHRGGVYPSMYWGRHPRADISQHALGQTPPGQTYPSMHWGRHTPPGRHIPACTGADTPPQADISQHALGQTPPLATVADSTHPNGMYSCSQRCCTKIKSKFNKKALKFPPAKHYYTRKEALRNQNFHVAKKHYLSCLNTLPTFLQQFYFVRKL